MARKPTTQKVLGQPSWPLRTRDVELYVTELGGHLGPVTFDRTGRKIQPYSVAPWAEEKIDPAAPVILKVLRGDFFCMPFGDNATAYRGERHPPHGETANARWRFESLDKDEARACLHLSLRTKTRRGRVDKYITLIPGHNAVYCRHVISEMSGPMNLGHHAMLKFPDEPESGRVATSPIRYGQVLPFEFENPAAGGYSALKPGALFKRLTRVPTAAGQMADLTRYPARRGFEDLVQVINAPSDNLAWSAVTFPKQRYTWFALKDPNVLASTVFWLSNGGRHYAPWSGRHVNVLGLEEVTSFFHVGLAESARSNDLTRRGFPTALRLTPRRPLTVNYIMGVVETPAGFDRVRRIRAEADRVVLTANTGKKVTAPLTSDFLWETQ